MRRPCRFAGALTGHRLVHTYKTVLLLRLLRLVRLLKSVTYWRKMGVDWFDTHWLPPSLTCLKSMTYPHFHNCSITCRVQNPA